MEHSLVNPNQCRAFGIRVNDDPTDDTRTFGMEFSDDYVVPFTIRGTTCIFQSRSPSTLELEMCKTFQVSDPETWDPTADIFKISAIGRGQLCASVSELHDVCSHDVCLYDFCDFSRLQDSSTHDIAQIRTSKRHHGIDANLLSLQWGIDWRKRRTL